MPFIPGLPWPFRAQPYLITPQSEEEDKYGHPVLVTPGEAAAIVRSLRRTSPKMSADLIDKYSKLCSDG